MQFRDDWNVWKMVKVGSGCVFVVLGAHARVLTSSMVATSNANFCMNINNGYFDVSEFVDASV